MNWPDLDGFSHYQTMLEAEARWEAWEQGQARLTVASWAADHQLDAEQTRQLLEMLGLIDYTHGKRASTKKKVLTKPE